MAYVYSQSAGTLTRGTSVIAQGYSGLGPDKNNPASQELQGKGPIPRGNWNIVNCITAPDTGPISLILAPQEGTDTFGRSGFRIHGDSITHPGEASHGCVIMPHVIRAEIWASADHVLEVVE